jgi:hypothetical protein
MGKVRDAETKLDFESSPTHTVVYDPETETLTRTGRNGDYDVVPVIENGLNVLLSLSNQSLIRQLRPIDKKSVLKITRTGTSYDTKYSVENLGPPTAQQTMKK